MIWLLYQIDKSLFYGRFSYIYFTVHSTKKRKSRSKRGHNVKLPEVGHTFISILPNFSVCSPVTTLDLQIIGLAKQAKTQISVP